MTPFSDSTGEQPRRHHHPLVVLLAAVCAGILLDRFAPLSLAVWSCAAAACLAAWAGLWRLRADAAAAIAVLAAAACLAGGWHHWRWRLFPADDLAAYLREAPQPVAVEAVALTAPRRVPAPPRDPLRAFRRGDSSRLEIRFLAMRDADDWRPAAGQAVLHVDGHLLDVDAGDRLRIFAQAARLRPPGNPGEPDFAAFSRAQRRRCRLAAGYPDCVQVVEKGSPFNAARWIERLRRRGEATLWSLLEHRHAPLAAALLLGSREQLDDERMEAFLTTNTIHFLAISGLHVGILAGGLFLALRWGLLPRAAALAVVAFATLGYTLLAGAPPSAVRATVLIWLVCWSLWCHRPPLAFNGLAAAGLVILAINPTDLFRTGPQLSFLAVATLAWFGPRFQKWNQQDALERLVAQTRPWPSRAIRWCARWLARAVAVALAVWAVSLPLVAARFHVVSPAAVLLAAPLSLPVAAALLSGFGVLIFSAIFPPLGAACAVACDASLWCIDRLVLAADGVPGIHYWLAGPADWWLLGFYGGLAGWLALPRYRPPPLWGLAALLAWITLGWFAPQAMGTHARELRCTFLDVGHGCCAVLQLPDGRTLLYDAGRLGSPESAARNVSGYLWSQGIRRVDGIVLSHADVDHYNAVPKLLERFPVGAVYVSPVMFRDDSAALRTLRRSLGEHGVPLYEVWDARDLPPAAGCALDVLHPGRAGSPGSDNASSVVLAVGYRGKRILLTGDVEAKGLERLLAAPPLDCDVVLAPHHGSAHSDPPGFAAWSTPEWVVISGGRAGESPDGGETAAAYRESRARVLHTARDGAVTVRVGDTVVVETFRPGER